MSEYLSKVEFIIDTDIISCFAKVGRLKLLEALFQKLLLPSEVIHDLIKAREAGYDYLAEVYKTNYEVINRKGEEFKKLLERKELHAGEVEAVCICKEDIENRVLITNDKQAKGYCKENGIEFMDLEDILYVIKRKSMLNKEGILQLIEDIETRERTEIKCKDTLLSD